MRFAGPDGPATIRSDAAVLALGGASWPRLGSDGGWVELIAGIRHRRRAAAVGELRLHRRLVGAFPRPFEGQPLKRIAVSIANARARGEAVITRNGLEGGCIYALSAPLRDAIAARGEAELRIDLRPDLDAAAWRPGSPCRAASNPSRRSCASLALSPAAIGLLSECAASGAGLRAMRCVGAGCLHQRSACASHRGCADRPGHIDRRGNFA